MPRRWLISAAVLVVASLFAAIGQALGVSIESGDVSQLGLLGGGARQDTDASAASTAPVLRFAVKGDWGTGGPAQASVTARMCAVRQRLPFDYVLTTGDNFYDAGVAGDANYYKPEACLLAYRGHQWRAAWGNHDIDSRDTAAVLGAPLEPRYYAWSAGGVDFFVYDGNAVSTSQAQWLRSTVCGSSARVKIIYGHQPPFSAGGHGSNAALQAMIAPVARECGVQMVIGAHDHIYMRSKPIDGVTYVLSGGGGDSLYTCDTTPDWLVDCQTVSHFLLVEVTRSAIEVTAMSASGLEIDRFSVPIGR